MIVMKFGGSSVESPDAIRRVAGIVKSRVEKCPVVVVSAMGKTTNALLDLARSAVAGDVEYETRWAELRKYHRDTATALVSASGLETLLRLIDSHFDELRQLLHGLAILGELTPRSIDTISSYGERLSSQIAAAAFRDSGIDAVHVDARDVIVTDSRHTQANPLFCETYEKLRHDLRSKTERQVVVMGGFIAATAEGVTTTLGRGGSDYSAAIVGAGIDAEEIQIWTDVDGMMTTDPRLIPEAQRVSEVSFDEAAELAFFGAKVLHPATVRPAIEKNIPVVILNSRRPEAEGTRIVKEAARSSSVIKAIACKRHITLVNIHSASMFMTHGFLRRVFEVFDRHQTSVDVVTTSEVNVSLTLDNADQLARLKKDLEEFAEVTVQKDLAMVSVVGEGIGEEAGVAGRVFKALENINVRLISQGASLRNLSLVISENDLPAALRSIHDEWFGKVANAARQ